MPTLGFIAAILFCLQWTGEARKPNQPVAGEIRINQLGYFPAGPKICCVVNTESDSFKVQDIRGRTVFNGALVDKGYWPASGEFVKTADFSTLDSIGTFTMVVPGKGISAPFRIADDLYREASVAAARTFFFQRASAPMEECYLSSFQRPLGHPDDTCYYHSSTGYPLGFRASPGGWYDAGDYGKYVVNASVTVGTMLSLYDWLPGVFPDGSLNIPESGNGLPDLLDEIRFELQWMLTMQDTDGGVFHKLTSLGHDGYVMPHESKSERYIMGKSTAATLGFSACLAQASRIYRFVDPDFSDVCLSGSERAYSWAKQNPARFYKNPVDVQTGEYGDTILSEEFFWSAAELFAATGQTEYYRLIRPELHTVQFRIGESWRTYVDKLGTFSLLSSGTIKRGDRQKITLALNRVSDSLALVMKEIPCRIPLDSFVWGSNSDILNAAILFAVSFEQTGEQNYLDRAVEAVDYIFGKNATGYSFVSGFGSNPVRNPHHRLLIADDNEEAFPGFLSGGPNGGMEDEAWMRSQGSCYRDKHPARAFVDDQESYASNEVCINWNAPLVFMLAWLDHQFDVSECMQK